MHTYYTYYYKNIMPNERKLLFTVISLASINIVQVIKTNLFNLHQYLPNQRFPLLLYLSCTQIWLEANNLIIKLYLIVEPLALKGNPKTYLYTDKWTSKCQVLSSCELSLTQIKLDQEIESMQ